MAARSIAKSKSVGKPLSAIQELLKNPEVSFAFAVLFADAVLVALIIAYVPYTKIDWDAYMSQVTGFLEGERDYSNLKGDTGPLVYPAGFLYIYSGIQYVTGGQVYPAQIFFGLLYIVNLGIILSIYVKTKAVPWWALSLLSLSKRVHSIFVLRLFNDCFAMTLLHAALLLLLYQKWHLGLIIFSGAVSVKMNVLLYAPPLFVLMLKAMDVFGIISALAGAALVQILLGLPFLLSYPVAYLSRAFNLGRIFIHFWSVNFKFVPEPIFVSKEFAIALLAAHLGLLTLFAHYRWSSMSEITENATAQSEEVIRSQQPGDLQHVPAAYKLNGKNYLKWSQLIRTILKGKGKINHLMGTAPNSSNPNFEVWEEEDAMIMAWLWGSMTPEISDTCMFLNTAKEIWDAVQLTYSKAKDAAQVYEVKVKTTAARQGNKTVTEYANQLSTLWQELDQYRVIKTKCSDDVAVLKNFIEQDRVYDFLVGLNPEFDQVRVQILGKSEVPCFNEVVAIVRGEESRRSLMLEPQVSINSAMVAGNGHKLNITPEKKLVSDERQSGGSRNQDRDKLWCTYCKKPRHTRERCWKLHGKPPSREWEQNGRQSRSGQANVAAGQIDEPPKSETAGLSQDELERVRALISSLEKPSSTCSLAYSGLGETQG